MHQLRLRVRQVFEGQLQPLSPIHQTLVEVFSFSYECKDIRALPLRRATNEISYSKI